MKVKISVLLVAFCMMSMLTFSQKSTNKAASKTDSTSLNSGSVSALKFRSIGPSLTSGRIADFAVNPYKYSEYYVAAASGHVWKTTNNGITFSPIFDGQKSYSIGCVTIDPSNTNIVWVGTGENNSQRSVAYGDGVYKSMDGGETWQNMGLTKSEHIGKICVHPSNSNIVYVAAQGPLWGPGGDRGLYKTIDGGKTWTKVLEISDNTGVSEVFMDLKNPEILYASAYQRRRHVHTLINGGPESMIYKSEDGGKNWRKINTGLPSGDKGRIGLAVSPVNSDYLYAIVELPESKGGIYRSTNKGESWEKRSDYKNVSAQYYSELFCDPKDVEKIYIVDTYSKISKDGGKTFSSLSVNSRHVDDHAFWIEPTNTQHMLIGGDGGVYESYDAGVNWDYKANLPIIQFYRVSVDNDLPFYNIYGGTQDNNSMGGPSQTRNSNGITNADWFITCGGDGFKSQIDPLDPNTVYSQSQYGGIIRFNKITGQDIDIRPMEPPTGEAYRWNWDAPLIISNHDHATLYMAANKLFKSSDRGNTWKVISPDLSRQIARDKIPVMGKIQSPEAVAKNASTSVYGNIVSLTESPKISGLLYVGSDDGQISVTTNDGESWANFTNFINVPETTYVSCLLASQHDENVVYASFNNQKRADFKPYILKSSDRGKTWKSIAGNLPSDEVVYSIAEDHVNGNLVFVGTEFGLYFTLDEGAHWVKLNSGIPSIAIRDIAIQKRENALVVATFGRGFYVLDDYSPLRTVKNVMDENKNYLFEVKNSLQYTFASPLGGGKRGSQGDNLYVADNPKYGVVFNVFFTESFSSLKANRIKKEAELNKANKNIDYPSIAQLKAEETEIEPSFYLLISDLNGNVLNRVKGNYQKGWQQIVWDMTLPNTNVAYSGMNDRKGGAMVAPGSYKVSMAILRNDSLIKTGNERTFKIIGLYGNDNPELLANVKFKSEVDELAKEYYAMGSRFNTLKNKVDNIYTTFKLSIKTSPDYVVKAKRAVEILDSINILLYGDNFLEARSEAFAPSIADRFSNIKWGLYSSTEAPTQTMRENFKIVSIFCKTQKAFLLEFESNEIKVLERELDRLNETYTPGR